MHVLLVDDLRPERESITRSLEQAKLRVDAVPDAKAAIASAGREPPDVIVLAWPPKGGADVVAQFRSMVGGKRPYVVVVLDKQPPSEITALFAAGADDFMRRPVVREELLARVEAPKRITSWAATHKPMVLDWTAGTDLARLAAAQNLGCLVAKDVGEMVGHSFEVVEGWSPELAVRPRSATLPMSLASDQVELRVSIVVDEPSLRSLAGTLLGDENAPSDQIEDVLREMTNTAAGAVKRAALEEDVTLTMGIPVNDSAVPSLGESARGWVAACAPAGIWIGIVGEVRKRENQRVAATKLREGMVLARDLRNQAGALLVAAGTRLTATSAERVASLLGERCLVEVACAA